MGLVSTEPDVQEEEGDSFPRGLLAGSRVSEVPLGECAEKPFQRPETKPACRQGPGVFEESSHRRVSSTQSASRLADNFISQVRESKEESW